MGIFVTNGLLQQKNIQYPVQLEIISRTGAVVRLQGETSEPLRPGDNCILLLDKGGEEFLTLLTKVVHYSFTLVGLQFIEIDDQSANELGEIIEKLDREKNGGSFCHSGSMGLFAITSRSYRNDS